MTERWLPIDGFDNYAISSDGRVQNVKTRRILKPYFTTVMQITLCANCIPHAYTLSKLLWETFNGAIPRTYAVRFKDGDNQHVTLDNLYLVRPEYYGRKFMRNKRSTP